MKRAAAIGVALALWVGGAVVTPEPIDGHEPQAQASKKCPKRQHSHKYARKCHKRTKHHSRHPNIHQTINNNTTNNTTTIYNPARTCKLNFIGICVE